MTKKDAYEFYCELANGWEITREEVIKRAKFLEYLEKYRDVKVASRVWENVMFVMRKTSNSAFVVSREYFKDAKEHLIGRINGHYDNVGNWADSNSDFDYAINAVRLWAEIVGFFNNGKV